MIIIPLDKTLKNNQPFLEQIMSYCQRKSVIKNQYFSQLYSILIEQIQKKLIRDLDQLNFNEIELSFNLWIETINMYNSQNVIDPSSPYIYISCKNNARFQTLII